jgi:hypothetical protein
MDTPQESVGHGKPAVKPDRVQKHKGEDQQKPPAKRICGCLPIRLPPRSGRKRGHKRSREKTLRTRWARRDVKIVFQRDFPHVGQGVDAHVPVARISGRHIGCVPKAVGAEPART